LCLRTHEISIYSEYFIQTFGDEYVDSKKTMDAETAAFHGHSVRDIPLDKLKALLLSKAELILSTLLDNILNSVAKDKGHAITFYFSYFR